MASEQDWRVTLRAGISPEIRERLNLHDEQDINLVLCRLGAEIETQEARVKELEPVAGAAVAWAAAREHGGVYMREADELSAAVRALAPKGGGNAG